MSFGFPSIFLPHSHEGKSSDLAQISTWTDFGGQRTLWSQVHRIHKGDFFKLTARVQSLHSLSLDDNQDRKTPVPVVIKLIDSSDIKNQLIVIARCDGAPLCKNSL